MKFFVSLLVVGTLLTAGSRVFGQDSREQFMTIKLFGGYNFWILGSAVFGSGSFSQDATYSASGFSFGGDILFLNPKGIQLGVSFAYLPMLVITAKDSTLSATMNASMNLIPVTASVVFNNGFFYTDLGLGLAFMAASANASSSLTSTNASTNWSAPAPAFIIKTGIGFNFKLVDFLGLDFGTTLYLPISDFGFGQLIGTEINPFLGIIMFSQFNIRAGICFYI